MEKQEQRILDCERELGSRGLLKVTVSNRSIVKKWMRAQGVPGAVVDGLTLSNLDRAYNDTTGAELRFWLTMGEAEEAKAQDAQKPVTSKPDDVFVVPAPTAPAIVSGAGLGAAIEQLINGTLAGIKPGIDEPRVLELIKNQIQEFGVLRTDVVVRDSEGAMRVEIKGAHKEFPTLLKIATCRQDDGFRPNIMISGPTGSGKTRACKDAAKALGLEFYSNGAISQDYQLVGFRDANGNYHETPLRKALGRPAWYLFDEFDSSDNSPMLCVAAVMANDGYDFPDMFVERHPDSVLSAAGNTWGNGATADFCGRVKIDGAIRSRFPVRLAWDYDESLERQICGDPDWAARVQKARALARKAGLKVIIDPRQTKAGAALIRGGFSSDDAARLTYLADLAPDQRAMVEG